MDDIAAFNYRYDTDVELALLQELWPLVNLRKNLFLPTKKATGYRLCKSGRHVREYDSSRTPADRVIDTGILLPPERLAPQQLQRSVDLTALTRQIQQELIHLATAKTQTQALAA